MGYSKDEVDDTYHDTPEWMKPKNKEEEKGFKPFKLGFNSLTFSNNKFVESTLLPINCFFLDLVQRLSAIPAPAK